jgi:hypothetical protein
MTFYLKMLNPTWLTLLNDLSHQIDRRFIVKNVILLNHFTNLLNHQNPRSIFGLTYLSKQISNRQDNFTTRNLIY